jgi:hypothetical protein
VKFVGRAWLELGHKVEVKRTRLGGLGMDEKAPAADISGKLDEAREDVLEEGCPEPFALVVDIYSEAGQQGNRLRVASSTLAHPVGR